MGTLEGVYGYLSGPMDLVQGDGVGYRADIIAAIKARGIKLNFLDPTNKPHGLAEEIGGSKLFLLELKKQGRWDEAVEHVKKIRHVDLRMVDLSDLIILWVDIDAHSCGTYFETCWAALERKPILAIVKQGKINCPNWLLAYLNHQEIFNNIDELVDYLEKVDSGDIEMDKRYCLVRKYFP